MLPVHYPYFVCLSSLLSVTVPASLELKRCATHAMLAQMIEEGKLQPWKVVSHKLPLSEAAEGYAKFDAKEFNKVAMLTAVSRGCWQLLAGVT
jgi:hypothetical protein